MIRRAIITVSLLLAIAALMIGAVSYRVSMGYAFGKSSNPPILITQCIRGRFQIHLISTTPGPVLRLTHLKEYGSFASDAVLGYVHCQAPAVTPDRLMAYTIFNTPRSISRLPKGSYVANADIVSMKMSFWMPLVVFLIYPTITFIRYPYHRRRHRRKMGLCLTCGYDLTGNVSGICPECRTKIPVDDSMEE